MAGGRGDGKPSEGNQRTKYVANDEPGDVGKITQLRVLEAI